jgi:outer membrane lipoprotein-sorting protein
MHDTNERRLCRAAAVVAVALLAAPAAVPASQPEAGPTEPGELDAEEILARCDDFHFFYEDAHMQVRSVLKDEHGDVEAMDTEVWEKGRKRLVTFHSPPEVAGMAVLVKDPDTIYVYEPEFNKVRRIASHAKKQSMLGSDYSFDEMATKRLGLSYTPTIVSEDAHSAVLRLEVEPGHDRAWPRLEVHVDKDRHFMAEKIHYYDEDGEKAKTETRRKLETSGGWTYPTVLTMTDHSRKHSTTNIVEEIAHDIGLEDKLFTKRHLIRED